MSSKYILLQIWSEDPRKLGWTSSTLFSRMVFVMYTIQILQRVFFSEPSWFNVFYYFKIIITNTVKLSQNVFLTDLSLADSPPSFVLVHVRPLKSCGGFSKIIISFWMNCNDKTHFVIIEFISIATTCSLAFGDSLNKIKTTNSKSRKIGH